MSGTLAIKTAGRTGNVLVDSLLWGQAWGSSHPTGNLSIPVWIYRSATSQPSPAQAAAITSVAAAFDKVISASLPVVFSASKQGIAFTFASAAKSIDAWTMPMQTIAGYTNATVVINRAGAAGDTKNLTPGSKAYAVYLHEFAHALGLAHPHDDGGAAGTPSLLMPGVTSPTSLGQFNLNQAVFTIMSYNDGWRTGPLGVSPSADYGHAMTPMALDLLALQHLYGADMTVATGNDTYRLPQFNQIGTGYACIWDAGGIDTILGAASLSNVIDLEAATGRVEAGGGGIVSHAQGIHGGFTIAAGVTIENATGGSASDTLNGNAASNVLSGGAGNDVLMGRGGADRLIGGVGSDRFVFTALSDSTTAARDTITDFSALVDTLDFSMIDAITATAALDAFSFVGNAAFTAAGQIRFYREGTNTIVALNVNSDLAADAALVLNGVVNLTSRDFGITQAVVNPIAPPSVISSTTLGTNGRDNLVGTSGADLIKGYGGQDTLTGGQGADQFVFEALADSSRFSASADLITDFIKGEDKINIAGIDANSTTAGDDSFVLLSGGILTQAGTLRSFYSGTETVIQGETDGKAGADFTIRLTGYHVLTAQDFIL
jgi:serralysin